MSIEIERAVAEEGRRRPPCIIDKTKALQVELQDYPEKGRTPALFKVWAGLNTSIFAAAGDERETICAMLGIPHLTSRQAAAVVDLPKAA